MAQLVTLANAILAAIPAAVVFFVAYGRYDGAFRDNVVFLYFIGGLIMGGFLGFMSLLAFELTQPLVGVILLSLLYPITIAIGVNRRKWQGERHAVFNGGAFGLGAAIMLSFTFLFRLYTDLRPATLAEAALLASGFAGLLFGLGLLAGNAVRVRKPVRVAFLGTAIVLPAVVFLGVHYQARFWTFPLLLAAYGAIFAVLAERRLLPEGVTLEERKNRRRRARRGDA